MQFQKIFKNLKFDKFKISTHQQDTIVPRNLIQNRNTKTTFLYIIYIFMTRLGS